MSARFGLLGLLSLLLLPTPVSAMDLQGYISEGDRFFHAGDYSAAEREFDRAVKDFPDEPIPRLARGHARFALRRYGGASRSLQQGIHLLPAWSRSRTELRGFFQDPGVFDANMIDLARALKARPDDRDLLFLLAYCLHFSGQPDQARTLFERLLALAPDHEAAQTFVDPDSFAPDRAI
jgi:tetratricopeptide (TPR) repeat protein